MAHGLPKDDLYILPDLPELRVEMGERLRNLRLRRGWLQCHVADYLGISAHRLKAYEYGDNAVPYDVLYGLCDLYEVSADVLLGLVEDEDEDAE
jgi:transcriptional regulator with XRE-family HTH domain